MMALRVGIIMPRITQISGISKMRPPDYEKMCLYMRICVNLNNPTGCIGRTWHFEAENAICTKVLVGIIRILELVS